MVQVNFYPNPFGPKFYFSKFPNFMPFEETELVISMVAAAFAANQNQYQSRKETITEIRNKDV
jgi:hypothetical protein